MEAVAEHQLDVLPELLDFVRRCCSILRFASYVADLVRLVVATCRHVYRDGCDRRGLEHGEALRRYLAIVFMSQFFSDFVGLLIGCISILSPHGR